MAGLGLGWCTLRCVADSSSQKKMPLAVGATRAAPASRCGPGEICRCCQHTVAELSGTSLSTPWRLGTALAYTPWEHGSSKPLRCSNSPTHPPTHSLSPRPSQVENEACTRSSALDPSSKPTCHSIDRCWASAACSLSAVAAVSYDASP